MNKYLSLTLWITIPTALILSILFYIFCLNRVAYQTVGVALNNNNGELSLQEKPGWYITSPLVSVKYVPLNPILVSSDPSHYARTVNQKLVQIKSDKVMDFVQCQGYNNIPMLVDLDNDGRGGSFKQMLVGYAYSSKNFEWLEILEDSTRHNQK